MATYTDLMNLYLPNRNDKIAVDQSLAENFQALEDKIGSSLLKDNTTYNSLVERFREIEAALKSAGHDYDVRSFGAKGDGLTDDNQAFIDAIGDGNRTVFVPAGHYRVDQINLPDNTYLVGEGKGITMITSNDNAPINNTVVTNADWNNGNSNIVIKGMTVDWNRVGSRQSDPTVVYRPEGCGVAVVYAEDVFVIDVESNNAKVHCFEVTSTRDIKTNLARRVYFQNCKATAGGDDNFTSHYCEHVYFENCFSYDPKDPLAGEGNNNCFEVDDGSTHVHLINCYGRGGVRGVEIKAHADPPAAQMTSLIGCTMENNILSYGMRHIERGYSTYPSSDTAYEVNMVDCVALNPIRVPNAYDSVPVQALYVANYKNVNISNFTAIGGEDDVTGDVCQFRFESEMIAVSNIAVRGFTQAASDIYVTGGTNSKGRVSIFGINCWKSAANGLVTGSGIDNSTFIGGQFIGNNVASSAAVKMYTQGNTVFGMEQYGYTNACDIEGVMYPIIPARTRAPLLAGTSNGHPKGDTSTVLSSTGGAIAHGSGSTVIGSSGGSEAISDRSMVLASNNSSASGYGMTLASYNSDNPVNDSIGGGWQSGSVRSSAARQWEISSRYGTVKATGAITGSSSFSDYAEYFESESGEAIPTGTIVALKGDKIVAAEEGDEPLGVISETAGNVLGEASFSWSERYLKNKFGGYIYETVTVTETKENDEEIEREVEMPKENPDYEPNKEYTSRKERAEWNIVGLIGQVYVRVDSTVNAGDSIKANKGIGTSDSEGFWKVMKITSQYDEKDGYGVAKIFIK